jgi:hypothetical protein
MALVYEASYDYEAVIGDKKIKFKQWTAKDERKYLMAMENEKTEVTDKLIFELLIKPCVEDKEIVLSVSEQKYLLIEIRKVSISDSFIDSIKCEECDEVTEVSIKIDDIISYEKAKYEKVKVDTFEFDLGAIRTNKEKDRLNLDKGIINYVFTDFLLHIHSIDIDGDLNDKFSFKELEKFMDSLPSKVFDEVFEKYQELTDSLELKYEFVCPSCNTKEIKDYTNIPGFLWI